ncbi:MAG: lamin tail domain-containing protein [Phycisphaerae bacterium]|nr:lamin tail domain-containing protein [Phycisphaerae bacterium]
MTRRLVYILILTLGAALFERPASADVVINELMYHPNSPTNTDEWDFIELHNPDGAAVDLSGWCIDGVGFCFSAATSIDAGGFLVVAKNAAAFQVKYGIPADGEFPGTLSNAGERIVLRNAASTIVDEVNYDDVPPWSPVADGEGPSIERIVTGSNGDTPRNWAACVAVAGHTARAVNSVTAAGLPPWISNVSHTQDVQPSQAIQVVADVEDGLTIQLFYRLGFAAEVSIPMHDDGAHGDGDADDGRFGAEIPGQPANTLVRYRIVVVGANGEMRYPRLDDTATYDGTVVADPTLSSQLPIFHWYVDPAVYAAALSHFLTDQTEPAVLFFNGRLYDNIRFRVRGQSSRSFPKKHWKFHMPQGHDFSEPSLIPIPFDQFNLQSNFADKSNLREILSYESFRDSGAPMNSAFPIRLQQNGSFFGLYTFVQAMDDDYLTVNQIDENGAWYKAFDDCRLRPLSQLPARYEKNTRLYEGYEDLHAFLTGINVPNTPTRRNFLFDNLDVPQTLNYIAVNTIIHNNDQVAKNYFLYRDTEGTGRWAMQAWDNDLTFGRNYGAGGAAVLTDGIWADNDDIGLPNRSPSHPLFGDSEHQKFDALWNQLIDVIHETPELRQMYYRRLRTLADQLLASDYYETRIAELSSLIAPEAALDVLRPWGQYGQQQTLSQAIALITDDYLPRRRNHLLNTHRVPGEIPAAQSPNPKVVINEIMYKPTSGDSAEFVELYNPSATESVDLSGWRLDGLALTIHPGTVILPGGYALFVKHDPTFRTHYGAGKYVAAQYSGNLSDSGERIALIDRNGNEVDVVEYESISPWPAGANGGGASLELIDASRDNNRVGNWAASLVAGGTPGAANSTAGSIAALAPVYVNEALAVNDGEHVDEALEADPWLEIYNGSLEPIDLGGYYLSDNYANPMKWPIPQGTIVCGKGWLIFWADSDIDQGALHTNFTLSPLGGAIGLYSPEGILIDYLNYPAAIVGISYGKFPDGGSQKNSLPRATAAAANTQGISALILNEYNGVSSTRFLKDNASDTHFGRVVGNGGDWFELVVTQDNLDIRGWQLEVRDNVGNAAATLDVLTFTQHPIWSNLRRGTIITVAEDVPEDVSYDPAGGDWWINVRANNSGTGIYITPDNFPVSNDNWQLTIVDQNGFVIFGPAGEGVQPVSGIGNDEVCKLEENPSQFISPQSDYRDGSSSTFGSPNIYSGGTLVQSFDALRNIFDTCTGPNECDDEDPCTVDACDNGECTHTPIAPCYLLTARLTDLQGPSAVLLADTGDTVEVAIDSSGLGQPVAAVQFTLHYDPARLQFLSMTPGDGAGSPWDGASVLLDNDNPGTGLYACDLSLGGGSTASASTAARVSFVVIDDGSIDEPTRLEFIPGCTAHIAKFTNAEGDVILPSFVNSPSIVTGAYPTLSLELSECSRCVRVLDSVTIQLRASDLDDPINGVQALLHFDPEILGSPTVQAGDGAGSPWDAAIVTPIESAPGDLTLGCVLLGSSASTDSVVARLTFPVVSNGTTAISFRQGQAPFHTKLTLSSDNTTVYPREYASLPILIDGVSKADMNGDALRDGADIQRFVEVIVDPFSAGAAERCAADMNLDGELSLDGDIELFVECLLSEVCPCQ